MGYAALFAAVGLVAALRTLRGKAADDCCAWESERTVNPVAALGVAYYTALVAALCLGLANVALALSLAGAACTCGLLLFMWQTGRWCPWCIASAAATFAALAAQILS